MSEVVLEPEVVASLSPFRRALRRAGADLARDLPWIGVDDPWAILVSEVMLQQTSTGRVREPWRRFMQAFPTPAHCADAALADVLRLWSGLGYPRRAKSLHESARVISEQWGGRVPSSVAQLRSLPGVGPYTARAVASFAFGRRVAVLDTNVGRVLARALANRPLKPSEAQAVADALLPRDHVASFNQAMLDLGAHYCAKVAHCAQCPVRAQCRWRREGGEDPAPRSAAVSRPQPSFPGSDRQVRGRIVRTLAGGALDRGELRRILADVEGDRVDAIVERLVHDGLVETSKELIALSGDSSASR